MMLERYADALEHLKAVTEVRSDFASAHRYAAQCAFKIGDKREGARHAKYDRIVTTSQAPKANTAFTQTSVPGRITLPVESALSPPA